MMPENTISSMPIDNMPNAEGDKPRINKKLILIITAVVLLALGAGTFAMLYKGPGQDVPDSQEPMLDFAAPESKIAGIQVLISDAGLSRGQYALVHEKLNKELPELEPESRFFSYVEQSLHFSTSGKTASSVEEIAVADSGKGGEQDTVELPDELKLAEDEIKVEEEESLDSVVFKMQAESGTEYEVVVSLDDSPKVTIEKK